MCKTIVWPACFAMLALLCLGVTLSSAADLDDDTAQGPDASAANKLDASQGDQSTDDDTGADDDSAPTGAKLPITMDGGSGCAVGAADPAGSTLWVLLAMGLPGAGIRLRKHP
jgi:hypothetical protein